MKIRMSDDHLVFEFGDQQVILRRDWLETDHCIKGSWANYATKREWISISEAKEISGTALDREYNQENLYISLSKGRTLISGMADEHLANAVAKLEREKKTGTADYKKLVKEMGRRGL